MHRFRVNFFFFFFVMLNRAVCVSHLLGAWGELWIGRYEGRSHGAEELSDRMRRGDVEPGYPATTRPRPNLVKTLISKLPKSESSPISEILHVFSSRLHCTIWFCGILCGSNVGFWSHNRVRAYGMGYFVFVFFDETFAYCSW
jgi:hypothetical protein